MRIIIFILIISSFSFGCNSKHAQHAQSENIKEERNSPTHSEIVWKDYDEVLFLLSQKHQINPSIVKSLITEYLRIHEPIKYWKLSLDYTEKDTTALNYIVKPREDVSITLQRLSQLYDIESSKLSSFIYDFKVFDKVLDASENY